VNRYRATFSRHRVGLILPIVIALLASSWYAMKQPHKYETSMAVWFDTAVPGPSSLVDPGNTNLSPSAEGQQTLQEMLGTQQFLIDVGRDGPLASSFGNGRPASVVNGEILSTLNNKFTLTSGGPQVLRINLTGTNPAYMPGTLGAVATEYVKQITGTLTARDQASVSYYQAQVDSSKQSLQQANAAVTAYQQAHPNVSPTNNVAFNQLTQAAFQAQETSTTNQNTLDQAQITLQDAAAPTAFHVIDPPSAAFRLSSKKHMIFTVVAGLAAGLVVSILALSALTALDKTARVPDDVETMLGMTVVGTVDETRRKPPAALLRRPGSK
jgi:uncharacterized protein involved in exopolysaccharide biosynthesis